MCDHPKWHSQHRLSKQMKPSHFAIFTLTASLSLSVLASSVDQAMSIDSSSIDSAISSQKKIDASEQRAQQLRNEIDQLNAQIQNLELYQRHLQSLIASQVQEEASLTQQLNDIESTKQGIVPLMYHMIDGLKKQLDQGLPIKRAQREQRISQLETVMSRADVSDAEKYRLILDAYQIEVDYGSKLGVYQERAVIDGIEREVDALHFGRVSLVARSIDRRSYWVWDLESQRWSTADTASHAQLNKAFDVANQRVTPELLYLPIQPKQLEGE